ncbi:unnamed protein product [Candida verbasci]|uniref:Uncharacterized protein n=1 Tax=Candida verbasci TaxID=1227364 RepID=A0A9W4TU98_9ASCO|nr:unnamed protein product [Candida verbasci]
MGFVNPGKPLSTKPSKKQIRVKRVRNASVNNHAAKKPKVLHFTFNSLSSDIIRKIFIFAGPNNSLPLVNKRTYHALKFNKDSSNTLWENYSLVLEMIKGYFLIDLSTRLNFDILNEKVKFYETKINKLREPRVFQNQHYKRILKNLKITKEWIEIYQKVEFKYCLLDTLLNYKFISVRLLESLNSSTFGGKGTTLLSFKTMEEVQLNTVQRLRFFRWKFKELGTHYSHLLKDLSDVPEETVDFERYNNYKEYFKSSCKDLEEASNPQLPYYDDEALPSEGFSAFSNLLNFQNGYVHGTGFFGEQENTVGRFRIPERIFNLSRLNLLQYLIENYTYGTIDGNSVLLKVLTPDIPKIYGSLICKIMI